MKRPVSKLLKGSLLLLLLASFTAVMVTVLCGGVQGRNGDPYPGTVRYIESSVKSRDCPLMFSTTLRRGVGAEGVMKTHLKNNR